MCFSTRGQQAIKIPFPLLSLPYYRKKKNEALYRRNETIVSDILALHFYYLQKKKESAIDDDDNSVSPKITKVKKINLKEKKNAKKASFEKIIPHRESSLCSSRMKASKVSK